MLVTDDRLNGFKFEGAESGDTFGGSVSAGGDLDNDGFDDLLIAMDLFRGFDKPGIVFFGDSVPINNYFAINENESFLANFFANNGNGAESSADSIIAIDGQAATTGDVITLASGASVTVTDAATGDFSFDVNGAFDFLAGPGSGGQRNLIESFDYTVEGDKSATVRIIVQGLDTAGDILTGSNGDDLLNAGIGADTIIDDQGADRLNGGEGDDDITGGRGNDIIDGGAGEDVMRGGAGNDRYFVDDPNDQIIENTGEGADIMTADGTGTFILATNVETLTLIGDTDGNGNGAANRINGGDGGNTIRGGNGRDIIGGGDGDDILLGQVGDDVLRGDAGEDDLRGAEGNDVIFGGDDDDTITGDDGADILLGEDGDDILNGGDAGDRLTGGAGADQLSGGDGNDIYVIEDTLDTIIENAGEGFDRVLAAANITALADNIEDILAIGTGGRSLTGNAENNKIFGADGDDFLDGAGGLDFLSGGLGDDTFVFEIGDTVREVSGGGDDIILFNADTANAGDTAFNQNNVEEFLMGGSENVNVTGTQLGERIAANSGDNALKGGAGDDLLQGGAGNDLLIGHVGADILVGGAGDDRIKAGSDGDTIVYAPGDGRDRVFGLGRDDAIDLTAFGFANLLEVIPNIQVSALGETILNFGGGDVLKLSGFPNIFLDDSDFIL